MTAGWCQSTKSLRDSQRPSGQHYPQGEIVGSGGAPCLEDRGVVNLIQDRSCRGEGDFRTRKRTWPSIDDQSVGQGETGRDLSRLGDITSTGQFAVCPTSPAHRVRDNGTAAEVGGRRRISGDLIPERWATSSRNGWQVPKTEPRLR